jgi:hypothetical protein
VFFIQFKQYDQRIHVCRTCLSHTVHHYHVSVAFMTIFRVIYNKIKNQNSLSKCKSEPHDITKNVFTFLYSHWISAYLLLKWVKFWPQSTLPKRRVGRHWHKMQSMIVFLWMGCKNSKIIANRLLALWFWKQIWTV